VEVSPILDLLVRGMTQLRGRRCIGVIAGSGTGSRFSLHLEDDVDNYTLFTPEQAITVGAMCSLAAEARQSSPRSS
jgi:hypothetical protein